MSSRAEDERTDAAAGAAPLGVPQGIDDAGVTGWLTAQVDGVEPPLSYRLIAGGRSNLTFEVSDRAGQRWVLRRPPMGHLLATAHDMGREHRIISAVGPAGIPAPRTVGYCGDESVTGAPFYVMEFVEGHVLHERGSAVALLGPEGCTRLSERVVDTLAALHAVDPDAVGLGDLGRREGYVARQLKRWYGQYQANVNDQGGPVVPDVDVAHGLLVAAVPEEGPGGIVHGDYRLDNMLVAGDGTIAAVLDWELCTLGDPLADLSMLMVYWGDPDEEAVLEDSATLDPGFFRREQVAERYEKVSGRSVEQIDFYLAFSYWRLACILEGVYVRYVSGAMGADGFDYSAYPERIRRLAATALAGAATLAPTPRRPRG